MVDIYLSQSGDSIYYEPFGALTLSYLICQPTTNLKLNLLFSMFICHYIYSFANGFMMSSSYTLSSVSNIIVQSLMNISVLTFLS